MIPEIHSKSEAKRVVSLIEKELHDLKEFYRWRKYPDEVPTEEKKYLVITSIYLNHPRKNIEDLSWSDIHKNMWDGCVHYWTNIPPQ